MAEAHPGLPYSFQSRGAGREDISHVLWEKHVPFAIREEWAQELVDLIPPCLASQSPSPQLQEELIKRPIYMYLSNLSNRIRLYLEEQLVDNKELYSFGIQLATTSSKEADVKLGMVILGQFENDVVTRILRTLGLHSSLTLYAVEASRFFRSKNRFIFDLAKHTWGFGKVVALQLLEPVRQDQKQWLFSHGPENHVATNISAILCLEKVDMIEFFQDLELTESNFSKLSHILAYCLEYHQLGAEPLRIMLSEKLVTAAGKYARTFIDLAALVVISNAIPDNCNIAPARGLRNKCRTLIRQLKWRKVIAAEVAYPSYSTSLILLVLKETGTLPDLKELTPILQRDPFDLDLLQFLLVDHPETYLGQVSEYLVAVLPKEVRKENPQVITPDSLTAENKPDLWFSYLLRALRQQNNYREDLLLMGLTSRYPEVRIEAVRGLRAGLGHWSELVLPALEHAVSLEPAEDIQNRYLRLLNRARGKGKARQYLAPARELIQPTAADISIIDTTVAGAGHRDLFEVDGELEAEAVLLLVREPKNRQDENAIIVATRKGYVLGYVPQTDNRTLAALMDGGETLYAVLKDFILEEDQLRIQIRLRRSGSRPHDGPGARGRPYN